MDKRDPGAAMSLMESTLEMSNQNKKEMTKTLKKQSPLYNIDERESRESEEEEEVKTPSRVCAPFPRTFSAFASVSSFNSTENRRRIESEMQSVWRTRKQQNPHIEASDELDEVHTKVLHKTI